MSGSQLVIVRVMDRRIQHALAAIHAQLAAPVTIAALARAASLSDSRFAHLFQQEVGTSPARYVHALRMIRARLLIERTFLSVKEVMAQVGCSDPSHFARDFRNFHGLSPSEWRTSAERRTGDSDALENATVERIATLANERRKPPAKPLPRARAPDQAVQPRL
jgi:transcriptional regulator GlxA family with amidase domain